MVNEGLNLVLNSFLLNSGFMQKQLLADVLQNRFS